MHHSVIDHDKIYRLFKEGLSVQILAKRFGLSEEATRKILRKKKGAEAPLKLPRT